MTRQRNFHSLDAFCSHQQGLEMPQCVMMSVVLGWMLMLAGPLVAQVPSAAQLQSPELEDKNLKPGANSFVESQARQLLEKNGYTDVSSLMNDKDGIWHGQATKDRKAVEVSVDFRGRIVAK